MEIEKLLEQYFEGLTTAAEEALLRRFFTSGKVPDNLMMYKLLFVHFDSEIKKPKNKLSSRRKTVMLMLSGAAAFAAMLLGSFFFATKQKQCPGKGDYVMIDGRCFTDAATIRNAIQKTLHEVSEADAILSDDKPVHIIDIVENQLKEFDFLLE